MQHIYGVDIDAQAVEVTKLSLLLKVLEGETGQAITQQLVLLHERALPDLAANIKCGNSLIDSAFYAGIQQMSLFDDEERYRINVFDWRRQFPDVLARGGFDAVIGNPPWISLSGKFGVDLYSKAEVAYLIKQFEGNTYMPNMYEYFVAQGLNLTRGGGHFAFVVPDRLGFNDQFVGLRKRILRETSILNLVYKVPFPGIVADTLVFVMRKGIAAHSHLVEVSEYDKPVIQRPQREFAEHPTSAFEYFESPEVMALTSKMAKAPMVAHLIDLCDLTSGFGGKASLVQATRSNERQVAAFKGESIGRYAIHAPFWFEFRPENITGRTTDVAKLGAVPKILLRKTGDQIIATYDNSGTFPEQSLYFLFNNHTDMDFLFLLGVLNSRAVNFYYRAKALTNKMSIAQVKKTQLDSLPLPRLDLTCEPDKVIHDRIVRMARQMLGLHQQLAQSQTPHEHDVLQRQIDGLDHQIDELVYDLYGLTNGEQCLIEDTTPY